MEADLNYWFTYKERLVDSLFKQNFYGYDAENIKIGNFWWLVVRLLNKKVACCCDWCVRVYPDIIFMEPDISGEYSYYCRLTDSINQILEKKKLPLLDPFSGCLLDPLGEGDFFPMEKRMLSQYHDIENKKKFNVFMHKIEKKWLECIDKYNDPRCMKAGKIDIRCSICLEDIKDDSKELVCKHTFHASCIAPWLKTNPCCPLCRCCLKEKAENSFSTWLFSQIHQE